MYMSDKPDFSVVQTLLDSLQLELRLLLDPPDGSRERPATTCLELRLCHPEYSSGQKLNTNCSVCSHTSTGNTIKMYLFNNGLISQLPRPNIYSIKFGLESWSDMVEFNF